MFVIIFIEIIFAVIISISITTRYRQCPADKIMVISGKVGGGRSCICLHGGAPFVWPIIQDCHFLDLTPLNILIDLRHVPTKDNIHIDMPATFCIGISTEPVIMQNAAERLLGLSTENVQNLANELITSQLRKIIYSKECIEIIFQRNSFMEAIQETVESELAKIGFRLIFTNIYDIRDDDGFIENLSKEGIDYYKNHFSNTLPDNTQSAALSSQSDNPAQKYGHEKAELIKTLEARIFELAAQIKELSPNETTNEPTPIDSATDYSTSLNNSTGLSNSFDLV